MNAPVILGDGLDMSDLAALSNAIETAIEVAQRMVDDIGREAVSSYHANPDGRRVSSMQRLAASNLRAVIGDLQNAAGRL